MRVQDLAYIFPMGLMFGAHVTPVDHQYYYWIDPEASLESNPIYSLADGRATDVQLMDSDYRLVIELPCGVSTIFIHLERFAGPLTEINGQLSDGEYKRFDIPVHAGDLIAYDGGTAGFDFSLHDERITLPGFVNAESYAAEPWKVHTVDPYDYFIDPVRRELLAVNLRQVEPLGGKIDYDVDGRLIGNWFVQGTNGYAGASDVSGIVQPDQQTGYWNTHLAVAPDPIDPRGVIVSLGSFQGRTGQFLVDDPDPRPEDVDIESGLVKYELVNWQYLHEATGEPWWGTPALMADDLMIAPGMEFHGVVLFQLLENSLLRMEAFPGCHADVVEGFAENAILYER